MNVKQILVVRKDLNMRKGKIAAQCAHASMKVLLDLMSVESDPLKQTTKYALEISEFSPMHEWLNGSFTKICVSVNSEKELDNIYHQAQLVNIPCAMIVDSGRTEFNNIPTKTVVAIGPDLSEKIDIITKNLVLL